MNRDFVHQLPLNVVLWLTICCTSGLADVYTYVDETGARVQLEARSIGSGQGFDALMRRDGQLQIVPASAIIDRTPTDGPQPITREEMAERINAMFGADLVRYQLHGDYVCALVLTDPIERSAESKATAFVQKAGRFMNRVDEVFVRYAKSHKFPLRPIEFPLVLLIFESDDDFIEYTIEATGGNGLSAANIIGFYSPITNWLAIRMSACDSFAVPLHEAIHQQMFNRVIQRLAPVPKWFDEGIATGFEGDGDRISISPARVNPRYAVPGTRLTQQVSWDRIITDDRAFTADVLAGEAYILAWSMHWLLANRHPAAYSEYVKELATRQPLETLTPQERRQRFEQAFGISHVELQQQFPDAIEAAMRRQKIRSDPPRADGGLQISRALGQADIKVVASGPLSGRIHAGGTLKNISPLRAMTFYVTVETGEGLYTEWVLPDVAPGRKLTLNDQPVARRYLPAVRMAPGSYQVSIRSTPSGSRAAQAWEAGNVPGPSLAE